MTYTIGPRPNTRTCCRSAGSVASPTIHAMTCPSDSMKPVATHSSSFAFRELMRSAAVLHPGSTSLTSTIPSIGAVPRGDRHCAHEPELSGLSPPLKSAGSDRNSVSDSCWVLGSRTPSSASFRVRAIASPDGSEMKLAAFCHPSRRSTISSKIDKGVSDLRLGVEEQEPSHS